MNEDPERCWESLERLLTEATNLYIPTKRTNRNSKSFWNEELSKASNELGFLRRKFIFTSNYQNGQQLANARDNFKTSLSESASTWISKISARMGHKHGKRVWSNYSRLFETKNLRDGPVQRLRRKSALRIMDKAENLKQTFFEAVQLKIPSLEEDHCQK